jgi:hypothetical protein
MLRALGRKSPEGAGELALARLAGRGVFSVCNALLLGPTVRLADLRVETASLARLRDAPLHLLPIDVRAGTAYFERAARRGLLEGHFLYRKYRFEDDRTAQVARVLLALPTRLEERSVPVALYDLGYNLGVARRLLPDVASRVPDLEREYFEVANAWNRDQTRMLEAAIEAAATGDAAVAELIEREASWVERHDGALLATCDRALDRLEREATAARGSPARAHARGRLLAAALSMSVAACGSRTELGPAEGSGTGAGGDATAEDVGTGGFTSSGDLSWGDGARPEYDANAPTDAGCSSYGDAAVDAAIPPGTLCPDGSDPKTSPFDFARSCTGCFGPTSLEFDANGALVSVQSANSEVVDCLHAFLGKSCYPSLACTVQTLVSHCWIA